MAATDTVESLTYVVSAWKASSGVITRPPSVMIDRFHSPSAVSAAVLALDADGLASDAAAVGSTAIQLVERLITRALTSKLSSPPTTGSSGV